jgi:hypothetical protein
MANQAISAAVNQLKQEHIRLCKELARVDEALSALGELDGAVVVPGKRGRKPAAPEQPKAKRRISASARKKMSEAARARWAARKKEEPAKAPAKKS